MEVATSEELEAADCPIKEQDNSAPTQKYSDGGYGWVVLASCFITTGLTSSFVRSFGIFFLDIQKYFETLAFKVSWINAITVAVFHLSSLLASALHLKLSHRVIAMIGGILSMLGLLLGSFAFSLNWMYFTTGFLLGLGNGFAWISSVSLINQYFTDRRPLANALSSAGECVFLFILTPFHQWLIDSMSWQQALMIISGIHLNICVCGALMRPYHLQKKCQNSASSFAATFRKDSCCKSLEHEKISASFIDLTLLKQPKFICMIFFGVFSVLGLFIPLIYLVPHAQDIGIEDLKAALLMSCWSVADLIGRLGCGWFANLRLLKSIRLAVIMTTALSVILLLFPLAKNYTSLVIFSCVCGFFVGTTMALLVTLITDVLGANKLSSALGLIMFFRTIGCLIGPPLAGLLVDWTGVYSTTFFLAGGGMLIASCFLIPIDYYLTCGQNSIQDTGREMETFISQGQSQEEAEKEKLGSDRTEDSASELTNAVSE
ncbi:monocarboxylate transporter 13 isoform X3 [Pristis pectinata]|nr:monocarboxylate transporter 13 isoform X3 [Pristis pectinata]XP_051868269.1 monocarboxylate transporter 13 isoform X3 [Pristis pectinata]XP_051868270.1 monocarboxylate transporter 13 isoform X3 [Pristis pectinata]